MSRISLQDAVFFDLNVIWLPNDFFQFVEIFHDLLLKLIGGLVILGLDLRVVRRLLWFELSILIYWRRLGGSFLGQFLLWLLLHLNFGHDFIFFFRVILLLSNHQSDFGRFLFNRLPWLLVKVLTLFVILPRLGIHLSPTN